MYNILAAAFVFYLGSFLVLGERKAVFRDIISETRSKVYYKKQYDKSGSVQKLFYYGFRKDMPHIYWLLNALYVILGFLFFLACVAAMVIVRWERQLFSFACWKLVFDTVVLVWIVIKTRYGRTKYRL